MRLLPLLKYEAQGRENESELAGMCLLGNKAMDLVVGQGTAAFKSF